MLSARAMLLVGFFVVNGMPTPALAGERGGFVPSADFRFRLEQDWDSQDASGTPRDDRARARVRARAKVVYRDADAFTFGVRVRSGSDMSHQSPHITVLDFDRNDTGDVDFNLDQWYVRGELRGAWGWVGRNDFPFWKQNELFWDDDATLPGVAAGWSSSAATRKVEVGVIAGHFSLPVGMQRTSGTLSAAQGVLALHREGIHATVAAGYFDLWADADDPDGALLLRGNGVRDYRVSQVSAKVAGAVGTKPVAVGFDWYRNHADAPSDPDPFAAAHRGEKDAWVAAVTWGKTKSVGDRLFAVYYARIEALALNASFAQDDWVRWGSAAETRAVDFKGWEFRHASKLTTRLMLVARLYLVESISSVEDGKRARLDLNWKF